MTGVDWIIIGVIALIVGGAVAYIIHAKRSGKKCIGCPDSGSCHAKKQEPTNGSGGNCGGGCHCHKEQR